MMKKNTLFPLIVVLLSVTACDNLKENTHRAREDLGAWYDHSRERLAGYIYDPYRHPPETPPAVASRYCYRVQTDILCYTEPVAGAENRFVAGQDAQGYIETVSFQGHSNAAMASPDASGGYLPAPSGAGIGGVYSAPPGVAPPLDTVSVSDLPGTESGVSAAPSSQQPFFFVQSPSVIDRMDGLKASYDSTRAKGEKASPGTSAEADKPLASAEPVAIPPALTDDSSSLQDSASGKPVPLMLKDLH